MISPNPPKTILILGYGREGKASVQYMQKRYPNARIGVADRQECDIDDSAHEWFCGKNYPSDISDWDMVIVAPGVPPQEPLLAQAKYLTTATNIFFAECEGTIIAVTGSKGKSTTSSLIAHILQAGKQPTYLVGNIGTPALHVLRQHNNPDALYVYELSSYQARLLTQGPEMAVITSLFPEHLDYHGSLEQYYQDKLRLTMCQTAQQHLFYHAGNVELASRIQHSTAQKHPWPDQEGVHVTAEGIIVLPNGEAVMPVQDIPLLGAHNVSNTLGAISVAAHLGISAEVIATHVRSFQALPHRLQQVGTYRGITFYNDSISTTPESTIAALEALPNTTTIFLGGTDRGYDFEKLAQHLQRKNIQNVVLFPESGERIQQAFAAISYTPQILHTRSMQEAVAFAYAHTPEQSMCLLSCAAPSYSLYKNFEERGKDFTTEVENQGSEV